MVRKMFADELAKNGLAPRMDQAYAHEVADLPPRPLPNPLPHSASEDARERAYAGEGREGVAKAG
jgi:hypothetical protein